MISWKKAPRNWRKGSSSDVCTDFPAKWSQSELLAMGWTHRIDDHKNQWLTWDTIFGSCIVTSYTILYHRREEESHHWTICRLKSTSSKERDWRMRRKKWERQREERRTYKRIVGGKNRFPIWFHIVQVNGSIHVSIQDFFGCDPCCIRSSPWIGSMFIKYIF